MGPDAGNHRARGGHAVSAVPRTDLDTADRRAAAALDGCRISVMVNPVVVGTQLDGLNAHGLALMFLFFFS
jgi:hypothetical protein